MSHAPQNETKKEKKKRILLRNRKNQEIFRALSIMRVAEEGLTAPEFDPDRHREEEDRKKRDKHVTWSAKTQEIRNRLNNSKRQAEDRWNRFAGTDSAGAMGR